MSALRIALSCWDYDRTRALQDGRVRVDGVDLTYLPLDVEETFFRMMRHAEFDVSELSLSSYVLSCTREPRPFVAIPVFPSREFRHSSIFVHEGAGIERPEDLRGRRVGIPEYQLTAVVWIRGILAEHYGVQPEDVVYRTGGLEAPGRIEKAPVQLPPGIRVEPVPAGATLAQLLADGEIDALYTPRAPSTLGRGVVRLFGDGREVEREYFARTGIFPIMHTVAIRRELYEQHRWLAQSLVKAFEAAKRVAIEDLEETSALKVALPWVTAELDETRRVLGFDYWPYGLEPNRHVLETFLRYHHEQGLSPRQLTPDELFAPESLESFVL
jgi:4,5-dihydroxyphthalate decarboxylase